MSYSLAGRVLTRRTLIVRIRTKERKRYTHTHTRRGLSAVDDLLSCELYRAGAAGVWRYLFLRGRDELPLLHVHPPLVRSLYLEAVAFLLRPRKEKAFLRVPAS